MRLFYRFDGVPNEVDIEMLPYILSSKVVIPERLADLIFAFGRQLSLRLGILSACFHVLRQAFIFLSPVSRIGGGQGLGGTADWKS